MVDYYLICYFVVMSCCFFISPFPLQFYSSIVYFLRHKELSCDVTFSDTFSFSAKNWKVILTF